MTQKVIFYSAQFGGRIFLVIFLFPGPVEEYSTYDPFMTPSLE